MNTVEWLENLTNDHTNVVAQHAGISDRTLRHQVKVGTISVENVIRIANAYGQNPLRVLINMGIADESWARVEDIEGALRRAESDQLTDEMLRRLEVSPNPDWDEPVGDLEAKRRKRSPHRFDDEQVETSEATPKVQTNEYDPSHHAAYNGEDEDEQRRRQEGTDDCD